MKACPVCSYIDPRDRQHYRPIAAADGNKGYRVFIPLEEFRARRRS